MLKRSDSFPSKKVECIWSDILDNLDAPNSETPRYLRPGGPFVAFPTAR